MKNVVFYRSFVKLGVFINQDSSGVLQVVLFLIVLFAEVAWLEIEHIIIKTTIGEKV
ncbi:hypothetical protein [Pseudobutyrivibrio xylanivorans]|uniref:hypothetical protein n=1 Tax=Pseudobutyrivibrio xylanivorans TaxID=185007 RepID=UPI00142ED87E|nr:hypothetical protein [Pseudobutyrivibrio xylanivorans]